VPQETGARLGASHCERNAAGENTQRPYPPAKRRKNAGRQPESPKLLPTNRRTRDNAAMNSRLALTLILFFMCAAISSLTQTKPDPATAKITALEAKWNDDYKRGDAAGMTAILSDDFIITVEDGNTFSKSGYLAHVADSELKVQISDMTDLRVRVHGAIAIVTGAYHEKGTSKGKAYESHDRFTDVWTKTPTGWQVLASHYSIPTNQ
jgi:ketosteroid isomerase-like protein